MTRKGKKPALLATVAAFGLVTTLVWANWEKLRGWYDFWQKFERLGDNPKGFSEYRHLQTGIVFVWVPGGTFDMGSLDDEVERYYGDNASNDMVTRIAKAFDTDDNLKALFNRLYGQAVKDRKA